jgi:hypothetical protein
MNLSTIRSKLDFIATLNPQAWDAVHPHTPFVFSNAHVELLVADVVKHAGVTLADKTLSKKVLDLSQKMAKQASASLSSTLDPGDELCPPYFYPVPRPLLDALGPSPEPWQAISSANQVELANILTHLSGLTTSTEFNTSLKSLATAVASAAASQIADDFERCGTVPRTPFPPRPGIANVKTAGANAV